MKIKKGDTVQMLAGKDRGKQGRIIEARPRDGKVIIENLNVHKKHQKPRPIRDASRMGKVGSSSSSMRTSAQEITTSVPRGSTRISDC